MNILKQSKFGRSVLFFILLWILSCNTHSRKRNITSILRGTEVSSGYNHSPKSEFKIDNKEYSLGVKADYDNSGNIYKLSIYKADGVLEYSRDELLKDTFILKNVDLNLHQNWIYSSKGLAKENEIQSVKMVNDSMLIFNEGNVTVFYKLD